jgi:hypothetical protein
MKWTDIDSSKQESGNNGRVLLSPREKTLENLKSALDSEDLKKIKEHYIPPPIVEEMESKKACLDSNFDSKFDFLKIFRSFFLFFNF